MFQSIIPGSRASLVFDVILFSMPLVLVALGFSLYRVKFHRSYDFHKKLQLLISGILLVVIVWFEVSVRVFGWTDSARPSPYFSTVLYPFLYFHMAIAISTTGMWVAQIGLAAKQFGKDYTISDKNRRAHVRRGWVTIALIILTTITGSIFYFLAFIAT